MFPSTLGVHILCRSTAQTATVQPRAQVVAFNLDTYAKYHLAGSLSKSGLSDFARDLVAGTVKPHYKSEEVWRPVRVLGVVRTVPSSCPRPVRIAKTSNQLRCTC